MLLFIVEDDPFYAELLQYHLSLNPEDEVLSFGSGKQCLEKLYLNPAIICLDYSLPDMSGEQVLKKVKITHPHIQVVIISAQEDIRTVVELLKQGASDYIVKDEDTKEKLWKALNHIRKQISLQKKIDLLQLEIGKRYELERSFVGTSPRIIKANALIAKAAASKITVTIIGESGTGKEVAAKTIHYNSDRRHTTFVAVNLSGIDSNKLEGELYGYAKGEKVGTNPRKIGYLEAANGGTIFLNEISELPLTLQPKLLRTLQSLEMHRVGDPENITLDIRVIVATNKNLADEVRQGRFREDLYYTILGLTIELPPLRDRGGDIILLAKHFLNKYCTAEKLEEMKFNTEAQQSLMQYSWPGNVRELKAVVELGCVMADSTTIKAEHLQLRPGANLKQLLNQELSLEEYNQLIIRHFLDKYNRNVVLTANKLGIGKSTIYRLIQDNKV